MYLLQGWHWGSLEALLVVYESIRLPIAGEDEIKYDKCNAKNIAKYMYSWPIEKTGYLLRRFFEKIPFE